MARHRRHSYRGRGRRGHKRRSGFGALGLPSLSVLRQSVPLKEAALGTGVGLGAGLGAIFALNKLNASRAAAGKPALGFTVDATGKTVPAIWQPFVPAIGGLVVGLAGSMLLRKSRSRAAAVLVGSVVGGLLVSGFQLIKAKFPAQFGDYVRVRLAGYGNVLINQGALGNLIVSVPNQGTAGAGLLGGGSRRMQSMNGLAYSAMSPAARAMNGYLRAKF
jgi:hypothetical protein